jgi:hypothetical protein
MSISAMVEKIKKCREVGATFLQRRYNRIQESGVRSQTLKPLGV